ncbi:MAG: hypothetical protein AAGI71_05170 [Bacteroidota bacterium]
MNIRDLNLGSSRLNTVRGDSTDGARGANQEAPGATPEASSTSDRVEISAQARASAPATVDTQELGFARKALYGIPPLSQERIADIFQRINEGYYSTPEVIKSVAERAAGDILGSGTPPTL